jgi:hypothetical protein
MGSIPVAGCKFCNRYDYLSSLQSLSSMFLIQKRHEGPILQENQIHSQLSRYHFKALYFLSDPPKVSRRTQKRPSTSS